MTQPPRYYSDPRAETGAVRFFERLLTHPKGPLAGQPFTLQPWQREIIAAIFGQKDRVTGLRRYRRAYLELPRGTGKTSMAAGIALLLLVADNEPGAEIFGAAADRAQAGLAFDIAKAMVEDSPQLKKLIKVYRHSLVVEATRSVYRVLSAEAYSKHGLNPHGIIFDELHAQPNRELFDVLNTAMGKRAQPLMIMITTAGWDRNSICWQQHEYARQVEAGIIDDPSYFPAIYSAPLEADWTNRAAWMMANPNWGVSVQPEFIEQECEVAKSTPAYQNTFRRLYLNQWVTQESRWIDMRAWDACATPLPDLTGETCYAGLDLASTTDIAACVLAFPPTDAHPLCLLPFFWIPQDRMTDRERRDRAPYATWTQQGHIEATPGNVIDYAFIRHRLNALAQTYDLREIAYDPWNATQLSLELQEDGIAMVELRQGMASLAAPSKELLRGVLAASLWHGGNPVLRWMADNTAAKSDASGNVRPDKAKSTGRIDGIVAAVMAVDRVSRHDPTGGKSVYEERELRMI